MRTILKLYERVLDAVDAVRLARTVHQLARETDALRAQAELEEERADIGEAAANEYRDLYTKAVLERDAARDGWERANQRAARLEEELALTKTRTEELAASLDIARGNAEKARWDVIGEKRLRKEAERALADMRDRVKS